MKAIFHPSKVLLMKTPIGLSTACSKAAMLPSFKAFITRSLQAVSDSMQITRLTTSNQIVL
jgi:hypothetical protein